jgi:hypothetical protein
LNRIRILFQKSKARKSQRCMTLLELVVSLALAGSLLSSIFYWIWSQNRLTKEMTLLRERIIQEEILALELQDSLGRTCSRPLTDENENISGFALEGKKLHFYFKSQVHPLPEMNLIQKAALYLEDEEFVLETSPCPELWTDDKVQAATQKKVLAKGIQNLQFYFLYIPIVESMEKKQIGTNLDKQIEKEPLKGLLQETGEDRSEIPVATIIGFVKDKAVRHIAVWREDGALIHSIERSSP